MAGVLPARVASVTTVGSPVKGTPVGELMAQVTAAPVVGGLASSIVNGFSYLLITLAGTPYDENFQGAMASPSTAGASAFNARFPAGVPTTACGEGSYSANGQRFYSMSGTGVLTHLFDPLDAFFTTTSLGMSEVSDGLVGRCSSHFGHVLCDNCPGNHGDEIHHLFALRGLFTPAPKAVCREHANRLRNGGL